MEKFVNEIVLKLSTKIPKENIEIVKSVIYLTLNDFDVTAKTTDLAVINDELPREAKIYLAARLVDGLSEKTLTQYKSTLDKFFSMIIKPVNEITTEDCRLFFYRIQSTSKMSNRTLDNYRSYLMAFFTWLNDNEYIQRNPCAPIKPFKYEKKVKKALTDMEIEKIRHAAKNDYERAIIEVLYSTGCRVSELVNIKLEDIDMQNGEVNILHGKGNKQRIGYLSAKAVLAIQDYVGARNYPTEYLFENFRQPHNQLTTRAIEKKTRELEDRTGIRIHPHKFRRTTATHLLKKGMPLEEIQIVLGHENIGTTMVYAKVDADSVKRNHIKCMS